MFQRLFGLKSKPILVPLHHKARRVMAVALKESKQKSHLIFDERFLDYILETKNFV